MILFKKLFFHLLTNSLLGVLLTCLTINALAEDVPVLQRQMQVDGYYRMALGDYEVTALYDGYTRIDNKLLIGISAKDISKLLHKMFVTDNDGVQTAINGFLVNTQNQLILFDTGADQCLDNASGFLEDNLKAAGYTPDQVNVVLLTHLHPDHACGLTKGGKRVFPNATVYIHQAEAGYWLNKQTDEAKQGIFKLAQEAVAPYQAANKFKTFTDQLPIDNVKLIATPGHTPGHMSYLVSSKGDSLLIWGDIIHSHAIQFPRPDVALEFDTDTKQAISSRKKILAYAANNKLWIAGAHLPFPGIGHVSVEGKGYVWIPIEYQPIAAQPKK